MAENDLPPSDLPISVLFTTCSRQKISLKEAREGPAFEVAAEDVQQQRSQQFINNNLSLPTRL